MTKKSKKSPYKSGQRGKTKKAQVQQKKYIHKNILQQALFHHQTGRLSQAETLYRQILLTEPDHAEALNFLGLLAHQVGKSEIGLELIGRALRCRPHYVEAYCNLGLIYHDQGKLEEAVENFRQALSLKPDYAEVLSNLGNALKDQGKLDEAEASFRRALSLMPDSAELHSNLANILRDLGKLDEAVTCYRKALTLKPDYAEAHNNLGVTLSAQGKLDEAIDSFRQALTFKGDYAEAYKNLGSAFKGQGKLNKAVASYRQALTLKPDFAEAHNSLGVIFKELGRTDDAIGCFKYAIALKPDYAGAYKNLSAIVRYTGVEDDIPAMEGLYRNENISDADRIDLGFALGKVFEDLGDYSRSFDFILAANRLKRKSYEYSIQKDHDLFERIKKTFSPHFFTSHQGSGKPDKTPIFILGMPRSGTTLVEQVLASSPLVFGAGELNILRELVTALCPAGTKNLFPECLLDHAMEAFEQMGSDYIGKILKLSHKADYITDKMPHNFLYVGIIKSILPEAKVIHCVRNPMDTCFSIFKKDFTERHEYAYDLVELGQYYNLYRDLMAHWEKVLPGFMYTLSYEAMVSDQQSQTKGLLDFCGLPWDDACLDFYKTERRVSTASLAQVRQPIYHSSVELWKRHEKHLEPLRKALFE